MKTVQFLLLVLVTAMILQICYCQTVRTTSDDSNKNVTLDSKSIPPKISASAQGIQNPINPTGPNMTLNVDNPTLVETLTPQLVNVISSQAGLDTSGNSQLTDTVNKPIDSTGMTSSNETKPTVPITNGQQPTNNIAAGTKPTEPLNNTTPTIQPNTLITTPPPTSTNNTSTPTLPNNPIINSSSTSNASITTSSLFSLNSDTQKLILDTQLTFKSQNIDQLIGSSHIFQKCLQYLRNSTKDFLNSSQLIFADSNITLVNITIYRVTYRVANGSFYRSSIFFSNASQQLAINSTDEVKPAPGKLGLMSSQMTDIDALLRRLYKDYINQADLRTVDDFQFPAMGLSVFIIRYSGSVGVFDVVMRVNSGIYNIMNFNKITVTLTNKNYFTILLNSSWALVQECISVDRFVSDFLKKRYNPNQIETTSVSVTASNTADRLRFCNSYIIDGNSTTICSSISLLTRWITVDYIKVGVVATLPSVDQYIESNFTDVINDQTFLLLDATARTQYSALLTGIPLGKIQYKIVPTGRAYRLTYLGIQNNVQVGYNPQ